MGAAGLCLGAGPKFASWLGRTATLPCPTDTSSGSDDEGSVQGDSQGTPTSSQGSINMEHWISQAIHGSTTSTTSSSSTQSGGSGTAHRLADVMAQTHIGECSHLLYALSCPWSPSQVSSRWSRSLCRKGHICSTGTQVAVSVPMLPAHTKVCT